MEHYFKVSYHFVLESAYEQKKKLEDAGLTTRCCVVAEEHKDVSGHRMIYWVCVKERTIG